MGEQGQQAGLTRYRRRQRATARDRDTQAARYARLALYSTWATAGLSAGIAVLALLYPLYLRHLDNNQDYREDMLFLESTFPNMINADQVADSETVFPVTGGPETDWQAVQLRVEERLDMWQTQRTGMSEIVSQIWRMPNSAHAIRPVQCLINSEINSWSALRLVAKLHLEKAPESRIREISAAALGSINSRAACIARLKATISWLKQPDEVLKARPVPLDICAVEGFTDECTATQQRYTNPPAVLD